MSHQQLHMQQQPQDHHSSSGPMLLPTSLSQLTAGVNGGGCVRTEQHGNQIVHVRGDSDSDLEALFSVLHSIDGRPPASSFKNRKLPASFFRPPDPKSATNGCSVSAAAGQVLHGRSVSSPAQIHHGGPTASGSHGKLSNNGSASGSDKFLNELAAGQQNVWEVSKNCPRYYLTPGLWQQDVPSQHGHPAGGVYQGRAVTAGVQSQHQHVPTTTTDFVHQDSLPHGWEQGITPDGEIYYINHVDKLTSWYDPRIPRHRQTVAPSRAGPHAMVPHSHPQHQQHLQQSQQHSHLSPKQQQQQHCQMMAHQQMLSNGQHAQISGSRSAHSEHYICLELHKLHKEKERLQQEQEAINCREMMLNELVRRTSATSPCGGVSVSDGQMKCASGVVTQQQQPEGALAMIQTMQSMYSSINPGVDSFVNPCNGSNVVESHARQNSTDSGLGGTTYSLPRSPEDYLSNVDEMDIQEDVINTQKPSNACYVTNGEQLGGPTQMQLSAGGDLIDGIGDQLFSSITGDVTSDDLLSDMDVHKMDNILYL